jgi:hypothetical protein
MPEQTSAARQLPALQPNSKRGPGAEYASEFCPVCSRRLAARACKLVCACGYYMSCSDYY